MNYREFSFAVIAVIIISLIWPSTSWVMSIIIAVIGLVIGHYVDKYWEDLKEMISKHKPRK